MFNRNKLPGKTLVIILILAFFGFIATVSFVGANTLQPINLNSGDDVNVTCKDGTLTLTNSFSSNGNLKCQSGTIGNGTGLKGEYFSGQDLTAVKLTRQDTKLDFDWVAGSPDTQIGVDNFSVRWTGQLLARYSETYTLYTTSDDGVRLWLNGKKIIDNWTNHSMSENSATISLNAGQKYDLKIEYYENTGKAILRFWWSSPSQPREIVPQSQLFVPAAPSTTAPATTTTAPTTTTTAPATTTTIPPTTTAAATTTVSPTTSPASTGVSDARFARLTRGVDLTLWFWTDNNQSPPFQSDQHYQSYITGKDLKLIKDLGFRHVRLSITPTLLFQESSPDVLNPKILPYLSSALDLIQSYGLATIIDMHFDSEGDTFKTRLVTDATFANKYATFWRTLAKYLSPRDPEMLFFEVFNEPTANDPQKWYSVQNQVLAAMRQGAPKHTLIADSNNQSADGSDEPYSLMEMIPVQDPNIVYNLHWYEPWVFVSQGAPFAENKNITGLPYPYDQATCNAVIAKLSRKTDINNATDYCNGKWNAQKMEVEIKKIFDWANKYKVRVTVNEFGAWPLNNIKESRLSWLRDTRTLFEKYNIGWTIWGYDDTFGLMSTEFVPADLTKVVDMDTVHALGL